MSNFVVSERYGDALVEHLGNDAKQLEDVFNELNAFSEYASTSSEFHHFVNTPSISHTQKESAFEKIIAPLGVSKTTAAFLKLLFAKQRIDCASEICDILFDRLQELKGETTALVRTAYPLDSDTEKKIKEKLEKHSGKKVLLEIQEDKSLLAGINVRLLGKTYDASVMNRLDKIQSHLLTA